MLIGDKDQELLREMESVVLVTNVSTVVCAACLALVLVEWGLAPRWRTLHNFVSLNQIAIATLVQCIHYLRVYNWFYEMSWVHYIFQRYMKIIFEIYLISRLSMSCWSLFATAYAYIKLVLLHRHRISGEKTIVFFVTYGLVALIKAVLYFGTIVMCNFECRNYLKIMYILQLSVSSMRAALVLMLFIKIGMSVMSCCAATVSRRNMKHVAALLGVAVMCDAFDLVHAIMFFKN